jgi:hypothetical protein
MFGVVAGRALHACNTQCVNVNTTYKKHRPDILHFVLANLL